MYHCATVDLHIQVLSLQLPYGAQMEVLRHTRPVHSGQQFQ